MRYLLPVLLLASLGLAQIFGPAGIPLTWDFGIVSFESDSIFSDYFSSTGATSFIYFAGDTLYMESSTASDGDFRVAFVEQDGTEHKYGFDDSADWFDWDNDGYMTGTFRATTGLVSDVNIQAGGGNNITILKTGVIQTEGTVTSLCLDGNDAGAGDVCAGTVGDNDLFIVYSRARIDGNVVSATYTAGATEEVWIEQSAADTVYLPAAPVTGDWFKVKFTHASGGVLAGNGKNIDGSATVSASENDAFDLIYNGTEWSIY